MIYRQFNKCSSFKFRIATFVNHHWVIFMMLILGAKAISAPNSGYRKSASAFWSSAMADERKYISADP